MNCWRCGRNLNVEEAPKNERVVIRCQRCKASNVVQDGNVPKPIDNCGTPWRQSVITK